MFRKSLLATMVALSANANGITTETRQTYMEEFGMASFMTPSQQASWYWQNLNQVMPTASVNKSGIATPLRREYINFNSVYDATFNNSKLFTLLCGDNPSVNSMMIVKDGKVIFEHHNIPDNTKHVWMSNAKVITGVLVAMLEAEGKVDVTLPLKTYIPSLKDKAWGGIAVIDVLNMQSGLDHEENDSTRANPNSWITKMMFAETGEAPNYIDTLFNIPMSKAPGKAFEYSSANTQMLGLLISTIEGKTVAEVLEQRIWTKVEMTSSSYYSLTPDGHEVVHGLFSSNIEDMVRFGMLLTPSSKSIATEDILAPSIVQRIQDSVKPGVYKVSPAHIGFVNMFPDDPIGATYQFDAVFADGDLFKGGMRGQGLYVSPKKNLVAAWFSNRIEEHNVAGYIRGLAKKL